ncbi:MAG: M16 family metallopeptidase [Bacteroidota bacterium]
MKNAIFSLLVLFALNVYAQPGYDWEIRKSADGRYTYKVIPNDPLQVRIYTLENGLTVMMSVNKKEPRIQTYIATKAGSKNDPADNTGLAHYLEHMLFKGTDKFGTKDWQKEKQQLDKIDSLYEQYNTTVDNAKRKSIYRQIDSVSLIASKYAIANEYDKMVGAIGATGTNAFTSLEQTAYVNNIPSNQLENWLNIEAERFRNPILRLFHTELEAVYEEKNISLDNDNRKVYEALLSGLFTRHPYGTQTTIGTVEHLKNPSLVKIRNYYNTYYVPNNMAIILSGDFDPSELIQKIDKKFSYMQPKPVPPFSFTPEPVNAQPVVKEVVGPDAESMMIGFKIPGANDKASLYLTLLDYLLSNSTAGLIDLNLVQKQKVLSAYSSSWINKDYSIHMLGGKPKQGQKLEEVRDLLLEQLAKIKKGDFDEDRLKAIIANFKVDRIRSSESNDSRAYEMLNAFTVDKDWKEVVTSLDELSKITKSDLMKFANNYYTQDYIVVYKRTGEDKNVVKVEKPEISPVDVNRTDASPFVTSILTNKTESIKPVFIDYDRDIMQMKLGGNVPVYYVRNNDNALFNMYYVLDMGKFNNIRLPIAIDLLQYLGTDKYSAEQLSIEFYKLACNFGVSSSDEQVYVYVSGPDENFEAATKLFEHLLANAKADQQALDNLVEMILKKRADAKKNKSQIFWGAMRSYAIYGKNNPQRYILSETELRALKAKDLVAQIKQLTTYEHKVYYYGPRDLKNLTLFLTKQHKLPTKLLPYPKPVSFTRAETKGNAVYFVNYDMVQAEIMWLNRQPDAFDENQLPVINLFNEYFGGGMSSVVFQTIRESKALAYSTFSRFNTPVKATDPYYIMAYIGTQADKINQAIPAMNELLQNMPLTESAFDNVKVALKNQIETERIIKEDILFNYMAAQKLGLSTDRRIATYEQLGSMNLQTVKDFHEKRYKNAPFNYFIMGNKEKVNMDELKKYGEVTELTLEEIFGY